ncbi:MAG TPA: type 1 glutamine amidotransferase [Rhodobacteraceae bacterium]|nr:type 1 glutamine amidotransferase [Paracoccaceae bacterium]
MKIGILETGHLSDTLKAKYGRYPAFFERLVAPHLPEAEFFAVAIVDGEVAESPEQADGWIITGSRSGAYESEPWIPQLEAFLRECLALRIPVVGICFGHQILAQAMGGKVENSAKGWGFGIHEYALMARPAWLAQIPQNFAIPAIHQDQVVEVPKGAQVFAKSDFCPIAGLVYGDINTPDAISIQPHPEMSAEFVADIAEERLQHIIAAAIVKPALKSLAKPADQEAWGKTIAAFFRQATAGR